MGFSQTSVDSSAAIAQARGASARSGWLATFVLLAFALCLASFGHVAPVAAEPAKGSLNGHPAFETSARPVVYAKVANRGSRQRILAPKFEAPSVLASMSHDQGDTVSGPALPWAREHAVSVGRVGLPARAPPTNGIL